MINNKAQLDMDIDPVAAIFAMIAALFAVVLSASMYGGLVMKLIVFAATFVVSYLVCAKIFSS